MIEAVSANGCSRELADQKQLADCVCSSENTEALSTANICVQKRCKWDDALAAMNATLGTLCHDRYKESRGYLLRIVAIVALTLTIPVVALRILSRLYCSGRLYWDDYTSIAATVRPTAPAGQVRVLTVCGGCRWFSSPCSLFSSKVSESRHSPYVSIYC